VQFERWERGGGGRVSTYVLYSIRALLRVRVRRRRDGDILKGSDSNEADQVTRENMVRALAPAKNQAESGM